MPSLVLGCIPKDRTGKLAGSQHAQARHVRLLARLEAGHRVALVVDAHPQLARLGRWSRRGRGRRRTWAVAGPRGRRGCCRTWRSRGTWPRRPCWWRPRSRVLRWSRRSPRPGSSPRCSRGSRTAPPRLSGSVGLADEVEPGSGSSALASRGSAGGEADDDARGHPHERRHEERDRPPSVPAHTPETPQGPVRLRALTNLATSAPSRAAGRAWPARAADCCAGVELISPNAAWAMARASSGASSR